MIKLKSQREIALMRKAGEITAAARAYAGKMVTAGITTREIDRAVHDFIVSKGAVPTFLNYSGYPASCCLSVNEELIHGIPGRRVLKDGDIVSVDVGATWHGYVGDCAATFTVNGVSSGDGVRKENLRVRLPEGTWLRFFTDVNDAERVWAAMLSERAEVPLLKPAVSADPEMEKIMFAFANALRGIHGLPAFREDAGLTDFSREHSEDMGKNDYFDHTSPSGVTLKDRVLRAGYDYHTYAENIARGTLGMPYEIFSLWVNSTWHRKNLLSNNERSGVGLYITDDEKAVFYWTQFFLTEF